MAEILRHLVSGDKYRFKDPTTGTDLDLTYITEKVIAMVRARHFVNPDYAVAFRFCSAFRTACLP